MKKSKGTKVVFSVFCAMVMAVSITSTALAAGDDPLAVIDAEENG